MVPLGKIGYSRFLSGSSSRRKSQTSYFAKQKAKAQYSFSPTTRSGLYFVSPILTCGYTINTKAPYFGGFSVNGARDLSNYRNENYDEFKRLIRKVELFKDSIQAQDDELLAI